MQTVYIAAKNIFLKCKSVQGVWFHSDKNVLPYCFYLFFFIIITQNPFTSILSTSFTTRLWKICKYELVDGLDDLWSNYLLSDNINHIMLLIPTLPRDFVLVNTQGCFTHLIIIPFSYNFRKPNYMKMMWSTAWSRNNPESYFLRKVYTLIYVL